jgi:hypothetical protein
MNPLLKLAEECAELAQVAIKLSQAKSKSRKKKFLERFREEKKDVLAALKASRPLLLRIDKQIKNKTRIKQKTSNTKSEK